MSKMIIGKALKKDNEKKEIEFAKKYQILSKKNCLFAEIINESETKQTELIKVNLNDYEAKEIGGGLISPGGIFIMKNENEILRQTIKN